MALLDEGPQNRSLDNDYGSTKGPNAAAAHRLAIFVGDPATGGVEFDSAGGYARVTLPNDGTTWPTPAAGGAKSSVQVPLPTSTGEWTIGGSPAVGTHFVLIDDADGVTRWDSGELASSISIDQAGQNRAVVATVYYNQLGA